MRKVVACNWRVEHVELLILIKSETCENLRINNEVLKMKKKRKSAKLLSFLKKW